MIETNTLEIQYEQLKDLTVVQRERKLEIELQLAQVQRLDRLIQLIGEMGEWLPTRE